MNIPEAAYPSGGNQAVAPAEFFDVEASATEWAEVYSGFFGMIDRAKAQDMALAELTGLNTRLQADTPSVAIEPIVSFTAQGYSDLRAMTAKINGVADPSDFIYDRLWSQYSPSEINSRQIGKPGLALPESGVSFMALAMLLGGDRSVEPGLYYTGKTYKRQRELVRNNTLMNPVDVAAVNGLRRVRGNEAPLLDAKTATRFPQMKMKLAGGASWAPNAYSDSRQFTLDGSFGDALSFFGVRLLGGAETT